MGKNVVVAGRSKNVGMPIAMLLHTDGRHERPGGRLEGVLAGCTEDPVLGVWIQVNVFSVVGDATVTISHRYTPKEQLCQHTKIADIIVAAAGLCNVPLIVKMSDVKLIFRRHGGILVLLLF